MVFAKKYIKYGPLFLFLIFLPFGQLLRVEFIWGGARLAISALDALVIFVLIFSFNPQSIKNVFFLALFFSFVISIFLGFSSWSGFFYLVRLLAFINLHYYALTLINPEKSRISNLFLKGLYASIWGFGFVGYIQYLFFPDLTVLKYFNWDDHLFRFVGSLFDPGFTAIILIFGFILGLYFFERKKKNVYLFSNIPLFLGLILTYSRAGYLAFFLAMIYLFLKKKNAKLMIAIIFIFLITLFILPHREGEGTNLKRTFSIKSRLIDYQETYLIFRKNPLTGIGFNNLCKEKVKVNGTYSFSHSCSGGDASLLHLLATGGVIAFFIFVNEVFKILSWLNLKSRVYVKGLIISLFVHSLFNDSLFFPWVMGILAFFLAAIIKKKKTFSGEIV